MTIVNNNVTNDRGIPLCDCFRRTLGTCDRIAWARSHRTFPRDEAIRLCAVVLNAPKMNIV
jgi:hypothetical protein